MGKTGRTPHKKAVDKVCALTQRNLRQNPEKLRLFFLFFVQTGDTWSGLSVQCTLQPVTTVIKKLEFPCSFSMPAFSRDSLWLLFFRGQAFSFRCVRFGWCCCSKCHLWCWEKAVLVHCRHLWLPRNSQQHLAHNLVGWNWQRVDSEAMNRSNCWDRENVYECTAFARPSSVWMFLSIVYVLIVLSQWNALRCHTRECLFIFVLKVESALVVKGHASRYYCTAHLAST